MLNLQAIEEQLAKGDPKLQATYQKLKERLTKPQMPSGEVVFVKANPVINPDNTVSMEAADPLEETTVFICSKCQKTCASNAGLKAHERKCNK